MVERLHRHGASSARVHIRQWLHGRVDANGETADAGHLRGHGLSVRRLQAPPLGDRVRQQLLPVSHAVVAAQSAHDSHREIADWLVLRLLHAGPDGDDVLPGDRHSLLGALAHRARSVPSGFRSRAFSDTFGLPSKWVPTLPIGEVRKTIFFMTVPDTQLDSAQSAPITADELFAGKGEMRALYRGF